MMPPNTNLKTMDWILSIELFQGKWNACPPLFMPAMYNGQH